ncbi:MAG: tetratricopeptide repeat protein [Chloroflexi bacterium]|nr:tetratricopeptide repeat protein [Chloroflexota bacterium]
MTTMPPSTFGKWVRTRRRQLDLTQSELGKRAGCSGAAIRKIEADERKPSRQLAELLAQVLQIPASERELFLQFARGVLVEEIRLTPKTHAHNLPALLTSTVDRTHDLANITSLLKDKTVHLVTLIGPPGIGKTRLSIHCGNELLDDFPDGVWFVDLADVTHADFFLPTVARFLPDLNLPPAPSLFQLLSGLRDKSLLLILDNFEQIVEGASLDAAQILKACPQVKMLVTSRVPLNLYGEHEYPLPPLSIPPRNAEKTQDALMRFESVQLFVARVRQHQPHFAVTPENAEAVIEICALLDGIPLALELAAATLRQMSLEEMVALLQRQGWAKHLAASARDLPHRQRTLENVIDWSYNLLDGEQRNVFAKLGVFSGWFDAEAASAVCETEVSPYLNALADHSLLVRESVNGKAHWRMLELIREAAFSKLTEEERQRAEFLRAEHFLRRIQALRQDAPREAQEAYFLTHFSNIQNAVTWAVRSNKAELSVPLVSLLTEYWETLGYFKEGFNVTTRLLRSKAEIEPRQRASLLNAASTLAWHQHDFDTALLYAKEAVEQEHEHGKENEDPMYRNLLGRIYIEQGKFTEARLALEECLALLSKRPGLNPGPPLAQLGEVALFEGRLDEAKSLLKKALTVLKKEDAIFRAMAHTDLAEVALAEGNFEKAWEYLQEAYPYAIQHVRRFIVFLCALAGWLALSNGGEDHSKAAQLFGAMNQLAEQWGVVLNAFYQTRNQERTRLVQKKLSAEKWQEAYASGSGWERSEALRQAGNILAVVR